MLPTTLCKQEAINSTAQNKNCLEEVNQLVSSLQVLEIMAPSLDRSLIPAAIKCLPRLCSLLGNSFKSVRHMAARCIAVLATLSTEEVSFQYILLPFITNKKYLLLKLIS